MKPFGGDPYEEGKDACERGVPRGGCPYPADSREHEAWIEGWDEAEEFKLVEEEEDEEPPEGRPA